MKKRLVIKVYGKNGLITRIPKDNEIEKIVIEEKYYCKNVLIKVKKNYYYKEINLNEAKRIIESNSTKY